MPCDSPTNGHITRLAVKQISSNEPNLNPMARDDEGLDYEVVSVLSMGKLTEVFVAVAASWSVDIKCCGQELTDGDGNPVLSAVAKTSNG